MTASWASRLAGVTVCVYVSSVSRAEECLADPAEPLYRFREPVEHFPQVNATDFVRWDVNS